jgi:hypothetical protein
VALFRKGTAEGVQKSLECFRASQASLPGFVTGGGGQPPQQKPTGTALTRRNVSSPSGRESGADRTKADRQSSESGIQIGSLLACTCASCQFPLNRFGGLVGTRDCAAFQLRLRAAQFRFPCEPIARLDFKAAQFSPPQTRRDTRGGAERVEYFSAPPPRLSASAAVNRFFHPLQLQTDPLLIFPFR